MIWRFGSHLATWSNTGGPSRLSFLCRRRRCVEYRSDGAKAVRNGSPQTRLAKTISGRIMTESQRKPLALTK